MFFHSELEPKSLLFGCADNSVIGCSLKKKSTNIKRCARDENFGKTNPRPIQRTGTTDTSDSGGNGDSTMVVTIMILAKWCGDSDDSW